MVDALPVILSDDFSIKWKDFIDSLNAFDLTLPNDQRLKESIERVFSLSDFIAGNCIRQPSILVDLIQTKDLWRSYHVGCYEEKLKNRINQVTNEISFKKCLRLFRSREMVRIGWRDLCGWADLSETVSDLSAFADACIDQTLAYLYNGQISEYGFPTDQSGEKINMVVLGMGKLGTGELNYSSDIDLIFAYPERGETRGGQKIISNEDFFLRLCRRMINILGASDSDGNLFRVDMRLRPYGENGPLIMNFDAMEEYYQLQGRDWERYAWIRARTVAGDKIAGESLLNRLRPFIYRRYLDYTVFDALREMKNKIALEVKRKDLADNVKLGPGGIREVEFFCQIFQILRGGISPVLQGCDTRTGLSILAKEKYVTQNTCKALLSAHRFLRDTEHRLQEFSDRQTHSIPSDPLNQCRLAYSMGFNNFESYIDVLNQMRETVHSHFNQLLEHEGSVDAVDESIQRLSEIWQNGSDQENSEKILMDSGFTNPNEVLAALKFLKESSETRALSQKGRERINRLIPKVLKEVGACDFPESVLSRIIDLIKVIERRTSYIALMLENPVALSHLIQLAGAGPWIINFLSRHPVLLDELLTPGTLYVPPEKAELKKEIRDKLSRIPSEDLEYQIETLCIFKQVNILRVAAADVTGVLPIMKVSDHLTYIAETVLEAVLEVSWDFLTQKHGIPTCRLNGRPCGMGFLIVGYGKLGGIELGYGSDLDLVFLHAGTEGQTKGGPAPIDNTYFFSRLGQRIVHLLTTHTRAGVIYETDMRLRPSGNAGPLVSHIDAFSEYQSKEGWIWEHQALLRARPICGDAHLAQYFEEIRKTVLSKERDQKQLQSGVGSMRHRLRMKRLKPDSKVFDLKEGEGGIVDIEFLVQYLILLKSHQFKQLLKWTDNVRFLEVLLENHIIDNRIADILKNAYLTFRAEIHRLSLKEKAATVPSDRFHDMRVQVQEIWKMFLP